MNFMVLEVAKKNSVFTGFKQEDPHYCTVIHWEESVLTWWPGGQLPRDEFCHFNVWWRKPLPNKWKRTMEEKSKARFWYQEATWTRRWTSLYKPALWKPKLWEKIKPTIKECVFWLKPTSVDTWRAINKENHSEWNDDFIKKLFSSRPKFDGKLTKTLILFCVNKPSTLNGNCHWQFSTRLISPL